MEKEPTLNFKPLSEGLGFHPYSNGLPYTPARPSPAQAPKPTPTTGTGAVAAGRPNFVFPQPSVQTKAQPAPAQIVAKSLPILPRLGWDYLTKRVLAYTIDSSINVILGMGALAASLWREQVTADFFFSSNVFFITAGFLMFFNWALVTAQEVAFGTSIGKKICGLSVEGSAMATLVRAVFFIPSFLCLGLGLLWAGFDSNRRGFHDLISGIQPEEN
jgi:hypothetical protein